LVDDVLVAENGRRFVYFGGCDYLRLSRHPAVHAAVCRALREHGLNVAASRATTGNHALYEELETELARFFGVEAAVLAASGYATNLLVAQTLAGLASHVLIDARAHPSLTDAAGLISPRVTRFAHRRVPNLERRLGRLPGGARPVIMTDGLFARDGALAPLGGYLEVCPRNGWLVVDDAHGAGVLGGQGRGTPELCGVHSPRLIHTITLSKAFGVFGGAVLTTRRLAERVRRGSRLFRGSTPMPLPLAAGALASLRVWQADGARRARLGANIARLRAALGGGGLVGPEPASPVVSVQATSPAAAGRLRRLLRRRGIYPSCIRYPGATEAGYFRFALSSEHTGRQVDMLAETLLACPGLRWLP
jgi:7-keto-8-aminopelargonate synthetase-like enzyme